MIDKGNYIQYLPQEDGPSVRLLLGFKVSKTEPWVRVENNFINRYILGLPYEKEHDSRELHHCFDLDEYQRVDVDRMCQGSILNANPMGLGKTVEAIRTLRELDVRNALIIVPKIIRKQWLMQFERWWPEAYKRCKIYDNPKKDTVVDDGSIYIINYEKLTSDSVLMKFKKWQWDALIVDEAHRIKNRNSKRTLACKSIPAKRKYPLTGTPITRYVDDLWSILHFIDPYYSGNSYWNFVNYFCVVEETFWGNKITGLTEDPFKLNVLRTLLSKCCIRNESVKVTKGRTVEVIKLPLEDSHRKVYNDIRKIALDKLPDTLTIANGAVLTMRLRQLCSWPGHFINNAPGTKFQWIEDLLSNTDEKIVVFSCFERSISALVDYLRSKEFRAQKITGKNDAEENETSKQMFLKDPHTRVLAGTFGAMREGYDGLQEVSRIVVMLDRDWSPALMDQAESRLDRMLQKLPVWVAYLEIENSFDQYVGRINIHKTDDIRRALDDKNS